MKLHPNTGFIFLAPNSSEKVLSCFVHLHVGGGGCYHYIPFHHIYRLFLISSWNERVGVTPRKIHRVLDPKTSHPVCWAMSLALVISSLLVSPCKTLIHHPEDGEGPQAELWASVGVYLLVQSFPLCISIQCCNAWVGIHFQMSPLIITATIFGHQLPSQGYEYLQASLISTKFVGTEYPW